MTVDDNLIAKLSKLSSLEIDDSKKEKLKAELGDIINFVENLNEIDVSGIEATFSTIEGGTPLREDVAVQNKDLKGQTKIEKEHIDNNQAVRDMLTKRGIVPENLPPAEDVKKLQRKLEGDEKKLLKNKKKGK